MLHAILFRHHDDRNFSIANKSAIFTSHSIQYRETCGDVLTQEEVESRSKKFTGVLFERIFTEHREVLDFLELRADQAAQGEQAALSKLSEAEYHTRLLLEEQRNQILSEARSEINMHELRVESADMAHCESNLQINSQRMELYQAKQPEDPFQERKNLAPYGIGGA